MIEMERLVLRPYVPEDWASVHDYAAMSAFSRFEAWGPNSVDDTKRFVRACIASMAANPILEYQLAVVLREDKRLIGGCTLKQTAVDVREAFLGYAIGPEYQRNGYATEAARALVAFGLGRLQLVRIYAECNAQNIASRRVLEKVGMRLVALKEKHKEVKGVMVDSCQYELLATEPLGE